MVALSFSDIAQIKFYLFDYVSAKWTVFDCLVPVQNFFKEHRNFPSGKC